MTKLKTIIFAALAALISFVVVFFNTEPNRYYGAQTVYRIYLNGVSIGLIEDKEELENYIDEEQKALKEKYNVDKVHIPKGLEIRQELTYSEDLEQSAEVYEKIKDIEPFTVEGYIITVGPDYSDIYLSRTKATNPDENTQTDIKFSEIYVLEKEIFEEAVNNTIFAFIDESEYELYVNETQPQIKDLEEGKFIETVYIKEKVTIKKDYIPVDKEIFMDDKTLAKYLLYGTTESQKTYKVKLGDTISLIAESNELNVREFLIANRDISSAETLLYPNQEVVVDLISPVFTLVEETTETQFQTKKFSTEIIEDTSIFVGYTEVIRAGVDGQELNTVKILKENGKVQRALTVNTIETKAAINRIVKTGKRTQFIVGNVGIWAWPTRSSGAYLSVYYGWDVLNGKSRYHAAIDITGTGCNSPIYAANDGTVVKVQYASDFGNYIVINHNNGYTTLYAHLSSRGFVSVGQAVQMGQLIGKMGTTGLSTGCHLHFVTTYNGATFDPLQLYR